MNALARRVFPPLLGAASCLTLALAGAWAETVPAPAASSVPGLGIGSAGPNDRRPLDIEADQGIEWQQNNNVYIARGNAKAARGNVTVFADMLVAHYRPAKKAAPQPGASQTGASPDTAQASAGTEIYRIEAEGNVRIQTPTQTIFGDKGIYDLDTTVAQMTGKHLRLVTPRDTVTARDSLEWYDNRQVAVARGNAVAIREEKRVTGDVLVAQVTKTGNEAARVNRVDASGHVLVTTTGEIGRGDKGVYDVDKGVATLAGNVTLTRGGNTASGHCAVVDLNTNVSRLLSTCPGLSGGTGERVKGLIVPAQKGPAGPGEKAGGQGGKR